MQASGIHIAVVFSFLLAVALLAEAVAVMSRPVPTRVQKERADIKAIESALQVYKQEYGRYPTTAEGLGELVSPSQQLEQARHPAGHLIKVPRDRWGREYQYAFPGVRSSDMPDVTTLGADGAPGGTGINADYGNWSDSPPSYPPPRERSASQRVLYQRFLLPGAFGLVTGFPVYAVGYARSRRAGASTREAAVGFHLGALVYFTCVFPVLAIAVSWL